MNVFRWQRISAQKSGFWYTRVLDFIPLSLLLLLVLRCRYAPPWRAANYKSELSLRFGQ